MTSGRNLTPQEDIAIRRMAALRTGDGRWKWTYDLIAAAVGVERQAVSESVRRACSEWVRLHDAGHIAPPD